MLKAYEPRVALTDVIVDQPVENMDKNQLSIKIYFIVKNIPTQVQNVDFTLERVR